MLFKFMSVGRGSAGDGEFSPERMRAFLSALPTNDPRRAARAVLERLVAMNQAEMPARARLRLLDMVRDHADWLLPQLEIRVARVTPPLAPPLREVAHAIEKLLKELAAGYSFVLLKAPAAWRIGFRRQLHVPLTRAIDFHARRLALSQRLYARNPGGVWRDLHELFRLAREWGVAERDVESPRASPLRLYREALLLAFAQPTKLLHGDFARAQAYLAQHADLATIAPAARKDDAACMFVIDPHRDRPGVAYAKRRDASFENGDLVVLTHALVQRLEQQLRKLRDGVPPSSLGLPDEARSSEYVELMQKLIAHWRGDRKQRTARMRFHPRVHLWVGLRDIWRTLRAEAPEEMPNADVTQRDRPARASEWIILNESSRGFALKYMSGTLPPINVGEVVALKARDRAALHVCLVRWIQSDNPEHFELGLQQLAPTVVAAVYRTGAPDADAPEPVLFFPEIPAQRRAPTLVAAPNRVRSDESFSLRHRRGRVALRASRVLEKTPSVELIEVAPQPA